MIGEGVDKLQKDVVNSLADGKKSMADNSILTSAVVSAGIIVLEMVKSSIYNVQCVSVCLSVCKCFSR